MKQNNKRRRSPWRFPNKETVRQAMKRAGMNPRQLALCIQVSPQTACNWRDGATVRPVYVPLLVQALSVTAPAAVTP